MKNAIIGVIVVIMLGVGGWFYATNMYHTDIGKIVSNPRDYEGKELAISGTVTDVFSFFVVKYYTLRDSTGDIPVVSSRSFLPVKGSKIRVKGRIQEAFSLGDQQLLVFMESSPS